jgi:hypothetical protein
MSATKGKRPMARVALILATLALLTPATGPATASASTVQIKILSDRADLITGGDALVEVVLPQGVAPSQVQVFAGTRNVTSAFAIRPNRRFIGMLKGLAIGRTMLKATVADGSGAVIAITNATTGGPSISGPHVEPWVCQTGAVDKDCNAPTKYEFMYASGGIGGQGAGQSGVFSASSFRPYDPANPPPDAAIARTTTDQGVTVPYIIRVETGYQNRDQYAIAVLYDPAKPWAPWAPQPQWNRKLVVTHGASCGIDHTTGTAPDVQNDAALSRGFAVMSTALDNAGHNCALVTQAESLIAAKQHVIESYGEIRYTIGTGCSGGSLVQYQVANAYPGMYQGILPQCSFPDAWSTAQQLVDYHLVRLYVEHPDRWAPGVEWDPVSIGAVEGHPNHVNSVILDELYFTVTGDPTNPCAGVTDAQRYDPATNPKGVRCTLADYMVNVFGRRPQDGFAGRPLDNIGVQYGLQALMSGTITPAQFADLNAKVGGADIDANPTAERAAADRPALANAYRSGAINTTSNLDQTAIIDLRGPDPGAFHDAYRAFAVRARLEREHGTYANQVIWQGFAPIIGDVQYTTQGLVAMDRWLAAVEKDHRNIPLSRKLISDKPADVHDQCSDGVGEVLPSMEACRAVVAIYTTPRVVAGESIATDQNKCQLKPLRRSEYTPIQFTDDEWASIVRAFPTGVCDWSKAGVDQQPTIPWQTYQDRMGGRGLGVAPASIAGGNVNVLAAHVDVPSSDALPATGVAPWTFGAAVAFAISLVLGFAMRVVPRRR